MSICIGEGHAGDCLSARFRRIFEAYPFAGCLCSICHVASDSAGTLPTTVSHVVHGADSLVFVGGFCFFLSVVQLT
jgi:hypothetical protein